MEQIDCTIVETAYDQRMEIINDINNDILKNLEILTVIKLIKDYVKKHDSVMVRLNKLQGHQGFITKNLKSFLNEVCNIRLYTNLETTKRCHRYWRNYTRIMFILHFNDDQDDKLNLEQELFNLTDNDTFFIRWEFDVSMLVLIIVVNVKIDS